MGSPTDLSNIQRRVMHERWILALLLLILAVVGYRSIDGSAVTKDAAQNLQMALNLSHQGVISTDEAAPWRPSMYREPLPVLLDVAAINVVDALLGKADAQQYFSGPRARYVKLQNIIWLLALAAGVFAVSRRITGSLPAAVVATVLASKYMVGETGTNVLYTELLAGALMILALAALERTQSEGGWGAAVAVGLLFGLLTLTKAATLYVFVFMLLVILTGHLTGVLWPGGRKRLWQLAAMSLAFAVVIAPWMLRNLETFGHAKISSRGGLVLYSRALWDELTPVEYRGTFYVWARPACQGALGRLLGFSPRDLERGGKLERLSDEPGTSVYDNDVAAESAGRPELAIGLHRRARAERVRLEKWYEESGRPFPDVDADEAMQREGMRIVLQHFGANLAMVMPLIWRSALMIFPAVLLGLIYSLSTRRHSLTLLLLPGFATLGFYAMATHFEPRPAMIVHSTAVLAVVVLANALWRRYAPVRTGTRAGAIAKHQEV